jgi:rSAM/selenodomain-associated transferase 2
MKILLVQGWQMLPIEHVLPDASETGVNQTPVRPGELQRTLGWLCCAAHKVTIAIEPNPSASPCESTASNHKRISRPALRVTFSLGKRTALSEAMTLSIVIPIMNDAEALRHAAAQLEELRARGVQIIIVDGGSADESKSVAETCADLVLQAALGRGAQMNAGAARATGEVLLFLHSDTHLPNDAGPLIEAAFADPARVWGRFDVRIVPTTPLLTLVAWAMNLRSRLTGIATGDQAIFVRRSTFDSVGGFAEIPLMEDIAISKRLKRKGTPVCLREKVSTSARRWKEHGVVRTIVLMWSLRLSYFLGADTRALATRYGYVPKAP